MSTIKVTNVQNPSAASAAITLDTNGQATLNGLAYPTSGSLSGRNRIINGDMRIDQRNAGASVTATTAFPYTVDRWQCGGSQNSKFTVQQSAVAPAGFVNSALITSSSAYTVGASEYFLFQQAIEGLNFSDLGWGTANAQSITISFRVRSSLTGTFGGAVNNSDNSRSYPFSYSISAANTWETKSVTIAGDTTGTWLTTNGIGLNVRFSLGSGSSVSGTAGSWAGTLYTSATGATSVVGTNGATFYLTGVQLEAGSTATPFERRSYGQELALCQRYYEEVFVFNAAGTTYVRDTVFFKQTKRSTPTGYVYARTPSGSGTNTVNKVYQSTGETAASVSQNNISSIRLDVNTGFTVNIDVYGRITIDSEL